MYHSHGKNPAIIKLWKSLLRCNPPPGHAYLITRKPAKINTCFIVFVSQSESLNKYQAHPPPMHVLLMLTACWDVYKGAFNPKKKENKH